MAVENGQPVEATYTNSRLVSKTSLATQTVAGPIDQTNTTNATSPTSGALKTAGGLAVALAAWIGGLFRVTNTTASTSTTSGAAVITGGVGVGGALNVGSNINAGGDIQSTGTMSGSNLSGTNTGDVTLGAVGSSPNGNGASLSGQVLTLQPANGSNPGVMTAGTQVIGGNKNFTGDVEIDGDVIVDGDFTVNGTLTTVNSATLDVTDANVTVNKGGNDTTAEGAGLTIERAGTDGSVVYQDSLASKFKAGAVGSESEIMTVGTAQTISGIKTFDADAIFQEAIRAENEINSTSTGSNVTLAPTKTVHVVTNASLVSVREVSLQNNQVMVLINRTGAAITIVDDTAGSFTSGILTGTGADLTLDDDASLLLARVEYSGPSHRIHVIGGSGGGGSPVFSPESANTVLAGPTTGSPAVPTFRALVSDDLPVVPISKGGTGQTAKAAAFDALSPMTTGGDLIYGGASGTGTRLANGSSGQYLKSNGGTSAPSWQSFTSPTVQRFTSGSGTYTTPANARWIRVTTRGGGGGGGGSGGGAGDGGSGGSTTFGSSLLTANGGSGGTAAGAGNTGGSVTVNSPAVAIDAVQGGGGGGGWSGSDPFQSGGVGGSSAAGGGGRAIVGAAGGAGASNSGGGGAGAGSAASIVAVGGGGGAGGTIVAIIYGPSSSYGYSVGSGGTSGSGGTNGFAGGAGGSGIIIVEEFYQ